MVRKVLLGRRRGCASAAMLEGLERRSLMSVAAGLDSDASAEAFSLVTPRGHTENKELDHNVKYTVLKPGTKRQTSGDMSLSAAAAASSPGFQIVVRFPDATLTPTQQAVFTAAADRWEQAITGDIPDVNTADLGLVDDIVIDASGPAIDGPGQVLGSAGPTALRGGTYLPARGVMRFDSADLAGMQADGSFDEVIVHEMGHVLGLGTLWSRKGLLGGSGTADPRFNGPLATAQFNALFGTTANSVPVENTGGQGTAEGHWREGGGTGNAFYNELMTGWLNGGIENPLSRVSLAQFADLGYPGVNVNAFDRYSPPGGGNAYPSVASLTGPASSATNATFTLTASGAADANGSVASVRFYRESNGLAGLQVFANSPGDVSADLLFATDTSSAGGFTATVSTSGLSTGSYTYYAQATDNLGLVSTSVSATHAVQLISAAPGTPDLLSDTGVSFTDDLTSRDNGAADRTLQFSVPGTLAGATVTLYAGGVAIGSATGVAGTTTVTTNGLVDLLDGTRVITARQTESGKPQSADSAGLSITVDTVKPAPDVVDVAPDPRTTGVDSIDVAFSERVYSFVAGDLKLTQTTAPTGSNLLTAGQALTTADNVTFTLNNLGSLTSKSGGYSLAISPMVSKVITDAAGNGLASLASDAWIHSLPTWLGATSGAAWDSATKELTVSGGASITADPGADAPLITANGAAAVLTINPSSSRAVHVGGLILSGGATATLASLGASRTAANHRVLVVDGNTFNIDAASTLDLADNDLLLNYSGASSPAASVQSMVGTGFNGGDWLGTRITSSTANADRSFALAVADNAKLVIPFNTTRLFAGQALDTTAVLVKFTHRVDLDLDGVITTNDATIFNSNYSEGAPATWTTGDLDFDGLFTTNDATLFNSYYNESLGVI